MTTFILLLVSAIIILRRSYMVYKTNKQIEEFKSVINEKNKEIEILKYKI
jgi:cell division protein FtsL